MHVIVQAIIEGILIGGVYALIASGLTLTFGIMKIVNVAQGATVILSAYLCYALYAQLGIDPFLSVVAVTPVVFCLGVGLYVAFIRPIREDREELSLLVTWAVALGIEGALAIAYGTTDRAIVTPYANNSLNVFGYFVPLVSALGFGLAVVLLCALYVLLFRTAFGRTVRATVQRPTAARLLGINVERTSALGFGLGLSTAAAAGAIYGLGNTFNPNSHYDLISTTLSIVVLGGLGSIAGAVAAGLILGVVDALVAVSLGPTWSGLVFFAVLIAVLLVRPTGIFGVSERGLA